jgi:hypothetical protein
MPPTTRDPITINLVQGDKAPSYDRGEGVTLSHITITEQGTANRLPIVDVVMKATNGKQFILALTGREWCMVAAAIRGANLRNHGIEEP